MLKVFSNEQLIAQLFDSQPDSVVWFSPVFDKKSSDKNQVTDFIAQYCNNAAAVILGVTPSEVIGTRLLATSLMDEESRGKIFEQCQKVWETGEPIEFTYHSPGMDRYFNVQRSKVQNGILSITRDRTKEVKDELEHQEQERKYQQMLDTSTDGVLLLEAVRNNKEEITDFRITYCNKAGFKLGNLPSDAVGKTVFEVLPHLEKDNQLHLHKQVVETGQPIRFETTFITPEGDEYGWFILSLTRFGDGLVSRFTDITQRKQHEQQIEEQKDLLNNIFDTSLNGMFACEAILNEKGEAVDFLMQKINAAFTKMAGMKEEDVIGKTYLSLFPTSKENGIFELNSHVFTTGVAVRKEIYYKGEKLDAWYDVSISKLGKNGIVVTFADITEVKKALIEIEHQKALLDNILKYSSSGISVTEIVRDAAGKVIDGRTLLANDAAIHFVGLPKEVYLTKTAGEIDPSIIESPLHQMIIKTLESGESFQTQYFLEPTQRWLELSVSKMDDNHLINIFTDTTATKEVQLGKEQWAEKLHTIINTSQAGFFLGSPVRTEQGEIVDFRFTMVNDVLASFVDKKSEDLIGELGSDWFIQYKSNGLFDCFRDTFQTGNKQQFDFHYVGETVEVWANIMTAKLGDELLGTFTDFTPIKQLQLQLEKIVEELKRSNANLEEFAYAASHDLQEPLRKISFFLDKLKKDLSPHLTAENSKMVERMESATTRMKSLINNLLAFSKVSVKPDVFKSVSLNNIVLQVVQDFEATVNETGAVITIADLPTVIGDELQLRQLFQNLIGNSLKYQKKDKIPEISVTSSIVEDVPVKFKTVLIGSKGPYYLIKLSDNGIGFEQENAEKIFQVFQRLHGRAEYEGTGVGLAIVQKVVANHKGYITAQGEPGTGATFSIWLPA